MQTKRLVSNEAETFRDVSLDYLKESFDVDFDTGIVRWRERPRHHFESRKVWLNFNARWAGKEAGTVHPVDRYRTVRLTTEKASYLIRAQRIVWCLAGRPFVEGRVIDHKNRNAGDNRLSNLRLCTQKQNARNRSQQRNNSSGHPGVYLFGTIERPWRARIHVDGKHIHLGLFATKAEAVAARSDAERYYFGDFRRIDDSAALSA